MTDSDRVLAKCERLLIPFMGLLYLVSIIDRLNVGFAALTMNRGLGRDLGGLRSRPRSHQFLSAALSSGRGGGRALPRHRALSHLLVSAKPPRAADRELHGGEPARLHHWRPNRKLSSNHGRIGRTPWLAMAVPARGFAGMSARLRRAQTGA